MTTSAGKSQLNKTIYSSLLAAPPAEGGQYHQSLRLPLHLETAKANTLGWMELCLEQDAQVHEPRHASEPAYLLT